MNNLESSNQYEATRSGSPSTVIEDTRVDISETFYSCNASPHPHFEDESRDCVRLYKAALEGDWNEAYNIMRTRNEIVKEPINNKWDTALHIAVAAKHKDFVRNLLVEMYNMNNVEGSNQCEAATNKTSNLCDSSLPLHFHDKSSDGIRLYKAALKGDWNEANTIIRTRNEIVRARINDKCDTALHIAVAAKHTRFVRNLLGKMQPDDLALPNKDGNTALCFAAASGVIKIADMLIKKNPTLPNIRGSKTLTPIHMAALFGRGEMVRYLKKQTDIEKLNDTDMRSLFLTIISADIYDVALWMFNKMENNKEALNHSPNGKEDTALHLMARKPGAISQKSQLNVFQNLANSIYKGCFHKEKMQTLAHQLVEKLWESVGLLPEEKFTNLLKSPSRLLFDAAESGNFEFLVILIRSNPDFIWKANDKGLSLFHVAALNRHKNIFNIIYELKGIKDFIAPYMENESDNNLLHLVACLPATNRVQVVSGAALQMQREILWFEAAKGIVPLSYIKTKNKKGDIAHELFTTQHENLRKDGEKWMKETATACMLVATLIATVVFAAAFTLPGGNESKDDTKLGFPQFRKKYWFDMFITSDSVSLLSSVTAIMIFLSILTSRYAEDDFRTNLPRKLMFGVLALFVSIISMVLAFTAAMILIRDKEPKYSLILIICLASLAAISFGWFQFPLWFEILRAAYFFKYLFRGRKSGIFL